ncbi:VPLPA-CTERM sorting domain-containing protein [Methyloglobulus sp.]|uniref:VPLPA-CTERM sorting domain-containing protein n=1 Tax=Methyloglobulus sp. TaxID=2518622 RepID=UPI0032B796DC
MCNKSRIFIASFYFSIFFLFNQTTVAAPVYTNVGTATNSSSPSSWLGFTFDITSAISGASNAKLTFDLRNDGSPSRTPDPTTSQVLFGQESSNYFVHLDYVSGLDTSHWRNVQLLIDGISYIDQYGAFNNHLGGEFSGTAMQGAGDARNVLGQSGYDASTFVLTPVSVSAVPLPAAVWLFGSGLLGLVGMRKKLSVTA